jgi:tRNA1(Val) A37 N6-methylase TrmN6
VRTTLDSLLDGALVLEQPAPGEGYRFNEDAVLLARFAVAGGDRIDHLVDLGAGVGAIALSACRLATVGRVTLLDADPQACELARRNLARTAVSGRVVQGDVAALPRDLGLADLLVSNPPYTARDAGRASNVEARDRARRGSLEPFVHAAGKLLTPDGRACVCQPSGSLVLLLRAVEAAGLFPRRAAFVFPPGDRPARLVMLEATRQPGRFVLEP